jgi:two-component system OmpR family sensor kinase
MHPRHHHPHHRHHRPWTKVGWYLRAKLHRRIFLWFSLSILVTVVVAGAAMFALARSGEQGWRREVHRVERFAGRLFADAWDQPQQLDALARHLSEDLSVGVQVRDAAGALRASHGPSCGHRAFSLPVRREGALLGRAEICWHSVPDGRRLSWLIPLGLAALVLWAASGKIARRLARPLAELEHVVTEIGSGKLSARASVNGQLGGEIEVVAEAVNAMAARIEKQLADQRELLAAVSHELRTPLARIRLLTELGRGGTAPEKVYDDLDREVVEIDALVGELLANSRIDFDALSVRPLEGAPLAARALERAGISPSLLEAPAHLPALEGDPTLLLRALANLIDNAKKHGGGLHRLTLRATATGVAFEAEDRGPGLPPGEEERLFEPFQKRGDRKEGSLGLGLALVRRIATAHRGRAYAHNRTEGGACVGFELPAASPGK